MSELLDQLGINWKLFISQIVNFFILLLVLRAFVYKPLLSTVENREKKIKEGLAKAEEADIRLKEVDEIAKHRIKEADNKSISIIKETEEKAKLLEHELVQKAEDHRVVLMKQIEDSFKKQDEEAKALVYKDAVELVKKAIIKTVELKPEEIDELLIKEAVNKLKDEISS